MFIFLTKMTFFEKNFNKMRNTAPAKNEISEIRNTESARIEIINVVNITGSPQYGAASQVSKPYISWFHVDFAVVPRVADFIFECRAGLSCNPSGRCFSISGNFILVRGLIRNLRKGGTLYFLVNFERGLKSGFD